MQIMHWKLDHQAMKEFLVDREFIRYWINQLSKLDASKVNQTNIPLILEKDINRQYNQIE